MGMHVNPDNEGFSRIKAGEYVDKTGLIALVNAAIGTSSSLMCSTRPRRFGKTFAAESLVAYYSCGCDSCALFEGLAIGSDPSFEQHLNAYNVVHLDMTAFRGADDVAQAVTDRIVGDLARELPEVSLRTESIELALADFVDATGRRFVFVIDENVRRNRKGQAIPYETIAIHAQRGEVLWKREGPRWRQLRGSRR